MNEATLQNENKISLETHRFQIRTLQAADVSSAYVGWFSDPLIQKYIPSARVGQTLASLKRYVEEKAKDSNVYLLGIFERDSGQHIGNIKFEPIDFEAGWAFVGILIGDPAWRGKGLFREVFEAVAEELHRTRRLCDFWLGVGIDNTAAIRAYEKSGFLQKPLPASLQHYHRPNSVEMVRSMKQPDTAVSLPPENRKFFLAQYIRTAPLNILSMGIKFLNGIAWTLLDNASLLGFFSLASAPGSITQRSLISDALVKARLPVISSKEEARSLVFTAVFVDSAIVAAFTILMMLFFLVTRADIVRNLGWPVFMGVSFLSLLEPLCSVAQGACNAKRHYAWNFVLGNSRIAAILILLAAFYYLRIHNARAGILIWIAASFFSFAVALGYFMVFMVNPFKDRLIFHKGFAALLRNNMGGLATYKLSVLLFGALPSLIIAYMPHAREVGWFSFAITLSGFLYAALAPINEQVYGPTLSRLVHQADYRQLLRRLLQMFLITLPMGCIASFLLLHFGPSLLRLVHKTAFLDSFHLLPALLAYQILMMLSAGSTYSLFCMNRYTTLGITYALGTLAAILWYWLFRERLDLALWALPLSIAVAGLSSFACILNA